MNLLHRFLLAIDEFGDQQERRIENASSHPLFVQIYGGYANAQNAIVKGRVLIRHRRFRAALPTDGIGTNLMNTYFRIYSREIPKVRLQIKVGNYLEEVVTDEEGYFQTTILLGTPLRTGRNKVEATVLYAPFAVQDVEVTEAWIYAPNPNAQLGIISDIDDTIIVTKSYINWQMLALTFLQNPFTRQALPDVPRWYQALSNTGERPFFYVSSSPWNLFDLLQQLFAIKKIPFGTMFLRDYGIDNREMIVGTHHNHKRIAIERILKSFPNMKFVLLGDTAQQDAYIYRDISQLYPKQIELIFIRDVGIRHLAAPVRLVVQELKRQDTAMYIIKSSHEGMGISKKKGLI